MSDELMENVGNEIVAARAGPAETVRERMARAAIVAVLEGIRDMEVTDPGRCRDQWVSGHNDLLSRYKAGAE